MNIKLSITVVIFCLFFYKGFAQWSGCSGINTPVCDTVHSQSDVRITKDGRNGAFICWLDLRSNSSFPDVYCQKIDSNGVFQWKKNGIKIGTGGQYTQMVNDNNGGVFIFYTTGDYKVHGQRVDKNGNLLWPSTGIEVCYLYAGTTMKFKAASDKMGGAIIVSGGGSNSGKPCVVAQRIDSVGILKWPSFNNIGGNIDPDYLDAYDFMVDENYSTIITWQQLDSDDNIYMQKLDTNGLKLLGSNGQVVSNAPNNQFDPKICTDRNYGYFINWGSWPPSGGIALSFIQHYNSAVNKLLPINGQLADTIAGYPHLIPTIDSGVFMLHYYLLTKLDKNGNHVWSVGIPFKINYPPNTAGNYQIINDAEGGVFIIWDENTYGHDIFANHVDKDGNFNWGPGGITVSNPYGTTQAKAQLTNDETGGFIATWEDGRYYISRNDIYAQRVNKFGILYGDKNLYKSISADTTFIKNSDSTYIRISGAKGNITWQNSIDGINFNTIYPVTSDTFIVINHMQASMFYRALIQVPHACYDTTMVIKINFITGIIENNFNKSVSIFPNPFSAVTTLKTTDSFFQNATLTIYNSVGQQIKQIKNISGLSITLYRDNLPNGLYFILITQNNKIFTKEKLIITDN